MFNYFHLIVTRYCSVQCNCRICWPLVQGIIDALLLFKRDRVPFVESVDSVLKVSIKRHRPNGHNQRSYYFDSYTFKGWLNVELHSHTA